jgi:hypothetical protein
MVQRGLQIELVYADTKKPFIEHTKDEKSTLKSSPASRVLSVSETGIDRGLLSQAMWMSRIWAA